MEWGTTVKLHSSNPEPLMSALDQKQTFKRLRLMSALTPKADIGSTNRSYPMNPEESPRGP
jgi:hypothetical protein